MAFYNTLHILERNSGEDEEKYYFKGILLSLPLKVWSHFQRWLSLDARPILKYRSGNFYLNKYQSVLRQFGKSFESVSRRIQYSLSVSRHFEDLFKSVLRRFEWFLNASQDAGHFSNKSSQSKKKETVVGSLSASRQGGDYQQVGMRDMNASSQGEGVLTTTRLADGMDEG